MGVDTVEPATEVPMEQANVAPETKPDEPEQKGCCGRKVAKEDPHAPPTTMEKGIAIFSLVMSLVTLIIAIVAFSELHGYVNDYNLVIASWDKQPYVDIDIMSGAACPSGYDGPITQTWPGLYPACWHSSAFGSSCNENYTSETSSCSYDAPSGCYDYTGTPAVTMHPILNHAFCLKRAGYTALSRPNVNSDGTCSSGVSCGLAGNKFCAQGTACPITDFYLEEGSIVHDYGQTDFKTITTSTPNYILYLKTDGFLTAPSISSGPRNAQDPTYLPIVDFYFVPNVPCYRGGCGYSRSYSNYESQFKSDHEYSRRGWRLRSPSCSGGCTDTDTRVVYVANEVSDAALMQSYSDIPSEFRASNYYNTFSYRTEIKWLSNCPRSRYDVKDKEDSVDTVDSSQSAALAITICSFVLCTVGTVIILFCCAASEEYRMSESYPWWRKCIKYSSYLLRLVVLICLVVTIIVCVGMLSFWEDVDGTKTQCSDPLTSNTFNQLGGKFSSLSKKDAAGVATSSTNSILDLFQWVARSMFGFLC
eukprot:TRINITY_DN1106_c0_g1_i1.p1 TRINITY_DN1106_c0_g1~~TRINITY_DN1106_c0_g1_i1.p1  ORF type:complete len:543 (-),score=99.79 TRINITY_DN1106_c0_g1_i1:163-1761(-)